MKGEELQGLGMEELKKLEKSLQGGLSRVAEIMVKLLLYITFNYFFQSKFNIVPFNFYLINFG